MPSLSTCLDQDTLSIIQNYTPIKTELEGVKNVGMGTALLIYSAVWRVFDSNDLGTNTPIATQGMQVSAYIFGQGALQLAIPIILTTGYVVSQYCL
jgi:hypothetical protein